MPLLGIPFRRILTLLSPLQPLRRSQNQLPLEAMNDLTRNQSSRLYPMNRSARIANRQQYWPDNDGGRHPFPNLKGCKNMKLIRNEWGFGGASGHTAYTSSSSTGEEERIRRLRSITSGAQKQATTPKISSRMPAPRFPPRQ